MSFSFVNSMNRPHENEESLTYTRARVYVDCTYTASIIIFRFKEFPPVLAIPIGTERNIQPLSLCLPQSCMSLRVGRANHIDKICSVGQLNGETTNNKQPKIAPIYALSIGKSLFQQRQQTISCFDLCTNSIDLLKYFRVHHPPFYLFLDLFICGILSHAATFVCYSSQEDTLSLSFSLDM